MAHRNDELVRRYFEAAASGDVDTLDELFADDVVAHIPGNHALSGDHRGKAAVFGFFAQLAERSSGTAQLHLREAITDDCFAVALTSASAQVGDHRIDHDPAVIVLRIEDGKFTELWTHHYNQPTMDNAWS